MNLERKREERVGKKYVNNTKELQRNTKEYKGIQRNIIL
jgi:hypothetical protein